MIRSVLGRLAAHPRFRGRLFQLAERYAVVRRLLWKHLAQTSELEFHRGDGGRCRSSPAFDAQTAILFSQWGYDPDRFAERVVVDLGAGPRLRSTYFRGARIHVVEPLAEQYRDLECCDYERAESVYSRPAEVVVRKLAGRAALVMCINVLDHVYAPEQVIEAAAEYLAAEGEILLSTDLHEPDPPGHPVGLDEPSLLRMCRAAGLEVRETTHGLGSVGVGYDGASGPNAINLKLVRAQPRPEPDGVPSSARGRAGPPAREPTGSG